MITQTEGRAGLFLEPDMEQFVESEYSDSRDNDDSERKENSGSFFQNQLNLQQEQNKNTLTDLIQNPPMSFEDAVKGQKKPIRQSDQPTRSAKRIDTIIDYIKEYDTRIPELLTARVQESGDKDRLLQWRIIVTANNFIFSQALTEIRNNDNKAGITYINKLLVWEPEPELLAKMMSNHETGKLFMDWCAEQNIQPSRIISEMYIILA